VICIRLPVGTLTGSIDLDDCERAQPQSRRRYFGDRLKLWN
jgi:hypothetical protein